MHEKARAVENWVKVFNIWLEGLKIHTGREMEGTCGMLNGRQKWVRHCNHLDWGGFGLIWGNHRFICSGKKGGIPSQEISISQPQGQG